MGTAFLLIKAESLELKAKSGWGAGRRNRCFHGGKGGCFHGGKKWVFSRGSRKRFSPYIYGRTLPFPIRNIFSST